MPDVVVPDLLDRPGQAHNSVGAFSVGDARKLDGLTASQYRIPAGTVVLNNSVLGWVKDGQRRPATASSLPSWATTTTRRSPRPWAASGSAWSR